jgi:acyl-CoA thioester hydrolase
MPRWTSAPRAFELPMTVLPEDIDEQGIASNVFILSWMNRAAIAHSTALGYPWERWVDLGAMFVVRRHEIDYRTSAREGDRLTLRTWPSFRKAATAHRHHEVIRDDGAVIARGMNVWAYISMATHKPTRMPPEVLTDFDPAKFLDLDPPA